MALLAPFPPKPLSEADTLRVGVAGAESNVAMYLAGLGCTARWISRVGGDPLGGRVADEVAAAGVDVSGVETDPYRPTGLLLKDVGTTGTGVHYYRAGSAASAMGPETLQRPQVWSAAALHVSGITPALSNSCRELMTQALLNRDRTRGRQMVSFDLNWRPMLWDDDAGPDLLLKLARAADIVFVGLDEARSLWGCDSAQAVGRLCENVGTVVVKDQRVGAAARIDGRWHFSPALQVEVVEEVGAGDAFAAGFLAAVQRGLEPTRLLRLAHLTAAAALLVVADVGPLLPEVEQARLLDASDSDWSTHVVASTGEQRWREERIEQP
jgi:2-dehydro-3-deoxygluconokinase